MRLITALLASAFALGATAGEAQLLPAGEFGARDGRPGPGKKWSISDAEGLRLAAQLNTIAQQTPVVIDYEHQTQLAERNGQPAPAAGWMKSFTWRLGQGLFASVEWTERAKTAIEAGEYRYISPVIQFEKASGRVVGLINAALVNLPAIVGMQAVMARLSAQFHQADHQENLMDREQLIKILGLKADATDADITAAIEALKGRPALPAGLAAALGLKTDADEATAVAALAALKTGGDAERTQVAALTTQVQQLQTQLNERDLAELLDGAIEACKITPAERKSLEEIGRRDLAWLKSHLTAKQPIPGLEGQSGGHERGARGNETDPQELARRASAYQAEQLKLGITVTAAQAVAHVSAAK